LKDKKLKRDKIKKKSNFIYHLKKYIIKIKGTKCEGINN
jgi:hypothetical protein